jgi:hypothetical protein
MPRDLKRNAVLVFGLAVLLFWAFMFAKHDPALRNIIPFGDDPYDAVGSFGVIVGILSALISLVRAYRPYPELRPSIAERVYLVRSQVAVVLVVLATLAADAVAMARHPSMWTGSASRNTLIVLPGGLTIAAIAVYSVIRASQQNLPKTDSSPWKRAGISVLLAILILVFYPERLIEGTATHLLTIVVGAFVLMAPMPPLLAALAPYPAGGAGVETTRTPGRFSSAKYRWGVVLLVGLLTGFGALAAEMQEGGSLPSVGRLLFVASVYVGLGTAGIAIAYAFLAEPLGFGSRG